MNRADIVELLKEVLGPNIRLENHTNWVNLCCPLAPWTHAGGHDASPSAGISIREDDVSIFHCWGCKSKGTVPWLLRKLESYTGESYTKIIRGLEQGEFLGGTLPEWGSKMAARGADRFLDEEYVDLYDSAAGHWYLRDRNISKETTEALGLLIDPEDSQGDERILFPVRDREGRLQGLTGRAVLDKIEPRIRDYHGLQKERSLLGIHLVDPSDPFVVAVEGLFDMAMVYQYGYSVVATMHAGLTDIQATRLLDLGMPLVNMFDNDQAGIDGREVFRKKLNNKVPMSYVSYPKRVLPRGGKGKCPKDPATCTMREVEEMLAKAQIL